MILFYPVVAGYLNLHAGVPMQIGLIPWFLVALYIMWVFLRQIFGELKANYNWSTLILVITTVAVAVSLIFAGFVVAIVIAIGVNIALSLIRKLLGG